MVPLTWTVLFHLLPYLVSLAITTGVALYAHRWRTVVGARAYGWVALSQAVWTLGYILELMSTGLNAKIFWDDVQFLASVGWFFGFYAFCVHYTGRTRPRSWGRWARFAIIPVVFIILVFTSKYHHLIRATTWLVPGAPFSELTYDFTVSVWIWSLYGYGVFVSGLMMLVGTYLRAPALYRAQVGTIVAAAAIPLLGTILTLGGVTKPFHRDTTPLTFAISNLIVAWGFYRFRMFDVVPVARHTVIESMHDAIIVLDTQNRVVDLNLSAREVIGFPPPSTVIGRPVTEVFAQWTDVVERYIDVEETAVNIPMEVGGEIRHFEFTVSPLSDRAGRIIGRLITVHDITDRMLAETSRQKSEEKYRLLVESTADWVWTADLEGRNTFSNEAVEDLLGYAVGEVAGHFVFEFMHPDDRAALGQVFQRALAQKIGWQRMAVRWVHKDGSVRYFESTARPILNENGDPIGFSGIDRDITERVRAESELQAHREQLEALVGARTVELTAALEKLQHRDVILRTVSAIGERLLKTPDWRDEIDGMMADLGAATGVDRIVVYRGYVEDGVRTRVNIHHEWVAAGIDSFIEDPRFRDIDVTEVGFREQLAGLMRKHPFYGHTSALAPEQRRLPQLWGVKSYLNMPVFVNDRLWGSMSVHSVREEREWDVTEVEVLQTAADMLGSTIQRQRAVHSLRESEARLNQAQRIARLGNWEQDFSTGSVYWSDEMYRILGFSPREIVPTPDLFFNAVHPEDLPHLAEVDHQTRLTCGTYDLDFRIVLPDGTVRNIHEQAEVLCGADGEPVKLMGTSQDITERKQIEMALQQSTERLSILHAIDRAILAAESPSAIGAAALAHIRRLVGCQRAGIATFDRAAADLIVVAVDSDFQSGWQVGGRYPITPQFLEALTALPPGNWLKVVDRRLQMPPLTQFYAAGVRCLVVVPLANRGGLIGALNLHFFDEMQAAQADIDAVFEIADQLAIAIQQMQLNDQVKQHAEELELRVAERTAELEAANRVKDEFVSNVSHELRTPITSLKLYHDLLVLRPDRFETYVTTLKRETDRLNDLIENLLALSRLDQNRVTFNFEPVALNDLIEEYAEDRTPLALDRALSLSAEPVPGLPLVNGDRNLLGQVLSVLLTNALNYTPPGGRIVLSTHISQFDGRVWTGFCVRDTGPGIPPEEHDKLFARFYRGAVGRNSGVSGTGLGLAIAREIVARHSGRMTLNSEGIPGHGATFCAWLPAEIS